MIHNLDLVISVDTSVAHLAGTMGKPVWLLLPHVPDWRWLLDREDSPWYPTMRLFRQQKPGDWDVPLDRLRSALSRNSRARWKASPPTDLEGAAERCRCKRTFGATSKIYCVGELALEASVETVTA